MEETLNEIIKIAQKELEKLGNENINEKHFNTNEFGQREFTNMGITYVEFKPNNFVSKDILPKEIIDNIVEDKRYLDDSKDVRFNNDIFDNNWDNSFIKKILNNEFKNKYLNNLNVDEVRCLTKEEAENLPDNLKETSRFGYWTMSPYTANSSGNAYVFFVWSDGYLYYYRVDDTYGVRPVFELRGEE